MEQMWMIDRPMRPTAATQFIDAASEQTQYQQDVFHSILKVIIVLCISLGIAYFMPFIQHRAWPSLIISLTMFTIAIYSLIANVILNRDNLQLLTRIWLGMATWTVFSFGLLQPDAFLNIMALGAIVVITLATFLEPVKNSYRWAAGNILSYVLVALFKNNLQIPHFELGLLRPVVIYGAPIAVLIIVTQVGRITTQYFKLSLIQSENRRKQLERQSKQLTAYAFEADSAREKAERSDRVKSAFLASMSHELRTPLNAVINFTRFVIDGDTGEINDEQHELLTEVVSSAKHLLNLINDVLDMSKIEAGSLNLT